jgi:serine carboxypeptidase-like clade 2
MLSLTLFVLSLLIILPTTKGSFVKVTFPDYSFGPPLDVYSGFVTVDASHGRALHYILIKAETNTDTSPLLVWYQGGPGCSGLMGLFVENGPFRVVPSENGSSTKLEYYPGLSWTQFANVLWVEQPAFVGFSYSNTSRDISTGDVQAALDNYKFLQLFLSSEFPEYYGRDLYFTGESYAGVYVPTLTKLVLSNPGALFDQFKGFMIGNPVFSCQDGFIGSSGPYFVESFQILYWHGFVSYTNYLNWTNHGCNDPKTAATPSCQYILELTYKQVGTIVQEVKRDISQPPNTWPSLDPDDIFQNFCTGNASLDFATSPSPEKQLCNSNNDLVTTYLNRPDVQSALNVPNTNWQVCHDLQYNIVGDSMNPYYEYFFKAKPSIQILVYSGDLDILTVPFVFTQPCIAQLSGKITSPWQPWFVNGATAGYVEVYDKYTYATVKGAGHEAPGYQPLTSFNMIKRFMTTGSLNDPEGLGYYRRSRSLKQGDMLRKYGLSPFFSNFEKK